MTDDIDIVEYLRLWASPDPDNQEVRDLHRAADEIERLRIQVAHYETQLKNADVVIDELEFDRDEWMRLAYKLIGQKL